MTLDINDFDGAPAIDLVQFLQAQAGTGWISGCVPSIVTTDDAIRIDVTAGTVYVENTELQFSQATIDLPDGDSTHARKDIVYIDSNNALASAQGTPRAPKPEDEAARHTYQPEPPDLKDISGGQTAGCPLAEVWVPAGAGGESDLSDGTIDYVRDRRVRPWADSVFASQSIPDHASQHERSGSDTLNVDDLGNFEVVATGSTSVPSGGSTTVDTGVSGSSAATFTVFLGPTDSTQDSEFAADIENDSSTGNYVVAIQETDTSNGGTVEYDIIRFR